MLLVVDTGNTNTVMAVHDGDSWRGIWRISTNPQRTSDEYWVWLQTMLVASGIKPHEITGAVIGTVVPAALYDIRRLCRDWLEVEPLVARAKLDWGFEIKIDNPDEVGADRLLNTLAGHHRYGGPMVIIDFGTATTFDVVDHDGAYLGGVIAAGIFKVGSHGRVSEPQPPATTSFVNWFAASIYSDSTGFAFTKLSGYRRVCAG